ncbi:MAG: universal stress protein [Nitriliruptoraceae bacterium]|nr:universal stress protein [Nitriliruptoraceae bacterium]
MAGTVLVGVDNSDASRRAVEFARDRAKALGVGLVLAHVIPWSPYSFTTPEENERRHQRREEELEAARTQIVDPLVASIGDGVEVIPVIRHGDRAELLVAFAREYDSAHILVGRTGESRMKTKIFGSVPSQLIQIADVPVTVVP